MPTDARAAATSPSTAVLFDLLSDETRLAIVRTLYRHGRDDPDGPGLSFSTLGDRLDVEDSGRFNYHLRRLRGPLVEKRGDGYALTPLGYRLGAFVVAESNAADSKEPAASSGG